MHEPIVQLDDLVRPLGYTRFIDEHWLPEVPFLSEPNPELVDRLRGLDVFSSPEALVERLTLPISLLGPDRLRARVAPSEALAFLERGFVLYCGGLEEQVVELRALSRQLAAELGAANLGLGIEAFVSRAGAVSSVHFDYDVNFQVLLGGSKRWHVAPNPQIRNPLQCYHPTTPATWAFNTCIDEAYARDPAIEPILPADARVYEARPGSTMYVPRGWWHEVESIDDGFAVNFNLVGATWATAMTKALCDALHGDEDAREYCYGSLADNPAILARSRERFDSIRRRAIAVLDDLTLEEVYLGGRNGRFVWTPATQRRSLVRTDDGWQLVTPQLTADPMPIADELVGLMKKLVPLRFPFGWAHLVVLAREEIRGEIGGIGAWNVLADLTEAGYLKRLPGR